MSYQVLARKWRPQTFRQTVGQEHVLQALINALDHNRLHHAYLFTGTRGVGKTTIARILAKCLNCETGVSSEPCGQCSACTEINEGRFVDLIEVDAASRTKVEDTRELLENVQYAPTRGRYKVYLIDEVHMLSSHSFNALLKTLEEPPPHVKFLLATTDPQKLPVTILSRCLQFNLKNMSAERVVGHLQDVLEKEMVPFEESALWQLGRAADGSMRDALSLTDQAIAFGSGKITDADVRAMLGTIDQTLVYQIVEALASLDGKTVLAAVETLSEFSPDYAAALAEMLSVLHRIAIAQVVPEAVDNTYGDRRQVLDLAGRIASEDVQLFYQMALLGRKDLPLSPDPRTGFEMVLLRMLAFKPQGVVAVPTQKLPNSQPAPSIPPPATPVAQPEQNISAPQPLESSSAPAAVDNRSPVEVAEPVSEHPPLKKSPVDTELLPPWEEQDAQSVDAEDGKSVTQADYEALHEAVGDTAVDNAPIGDSVKSQPETIKVKADTPDSGLYTQPSASQLYADVQAQEQEQEQEQEVETPTPATKPHSVPSQANDRLKIPLAALTKENWPDVYRQLGVGGVLQSTLSNCVLEGRHGSLLHFILDEHNSTLFDERHQQRAADLLETYFEEPVQVNIRVGAVPGETPAAILIRERQQQQDRAKQVIESDPLVQEMLREFSASILEESIKPVV